MPMAFCHDPTDPSNLTADERIKEIASLLAAGILRLHRHAAIPTASCPPNSHPILPPGALMTPRKRGFMDTVVNGK
jgi:hypothetical protein